MDDNDDDGSFDDEEGEDIDEYPPDLGDELGDRFDDDCCDKDD